MTYGDAVGATFAVPAKAITRPGTLLDAGWAYLDDDIHILRIVAKIACFLRIDHLGPEGRPHMAAVRRRTRPLHIPHRRVSNVIALQNRAAAHDLGIRNTVITGNRLTGRLTCRCSAQSKLSITDSESLREAGCRCKHCQQKKQGFYHFVNPPGFQ